MANLDVQRKKKSPLPWILFLLLIVAVVCYFIWRQYYGNNAPVTSTQDSTVTTPMDTTRPR